MEDPDTGIRPLPATEDPDDYYDRKREEEFEDTLYEEDLGRNGWDGIPRKDKL